MNVLEDILHRCRLIEEKQSLNVQGEDVSIAMRCNILDSHFCGLLEFHFEMSFSNF